MIYTEEHKELAWRIISAKEHAARAEMRHMALVGECIGHIIRGERPFQHEFETENHHNGDPFTMREIVWARVKPPSAAEIKESFTLLDMKEYDEALCILEQVARGEEVT